MSGPSGLPSIVPASSSAIGETLIDPAASAAAGLLGSLMTCSPAHWVPFQNRIEIVGKAVREADHAVLGGGRRAAQAKAEQRHSRSHRQDEPEGYDYSSFTHYITHYIISLISAPVMQS